MEYFMMNKQSSIINGFNFMEKYGGLDSNAEIILYGWILSSLRKKLAKDRGERDD